VDIINAINLGRPIPVADGFTGDVITLDAAIDSSFPNGRRLGGGTAPNRNQVNVNSVLISLIVAGNPGRRAAGLAKGVEVNDKDYLDRFPFLAPRTRGCFQGHGGINTVVSGGYVQFVPSDAAVCYAVVVDNSTNDGRFIPAADYRP
jgi:hypothetical protein